MAKAGSFIQRSLGTFAGQLLLLLLLFMCCRILTMDVFFHGFLRFFDWLNARIFGTRVPAVFASDPYHTGSVIFSAFLNPWFTVAVVALYLPIVLRWKAFAAGSYQWQERLIVGTTAFILVWELCTYGYNYYLDSAFYLDRSVLFVLFLLLLRYRVVLPLFIAFVFVYRSQFNYPVDGFPLLDVWLLLDVLIAYLAYIYLTLLVSGQKVQFVYFALCIFGATYFYSGLKKILISPHGYEWLLHNNPGYLFMNMHMLGFMVHADNATLSRLYNILDTWRVPLQAIVLVIELAGILLLRSRKLGIILLASCILLHLGIFAMGSTLFWKWMLVELAFIIVLLRDKSANELFSKRGFLMSVLVIIISPIWLQPNMYGWHDTAVNQYFSFEVTDDKGNTYQLPKDEMQPYHQWFQFNTFHFLLKDQPCLWVTPFGFTGSYKLMREIESGGPQAYDTLLLKYGTNVYKETKVNKFNEFITTYFRNRNRRIGTAFPLAALHTPPHLFNDVTGVAYKDQAPVKTFRVVYHVSYIRRGGQPTMMHEKVVDELNIGF
jgi:hypothetical protein